jgi:hypothetical protein
VFIRPTGLQTGSFCQTGAAIKVICCMISHVTAGSLLIGISCIWATAIASAELDQASSCNRLARLRRDRRHSCTMIIGPPPTQQVPPQLPQTPAQIFKLQKHNLCFCYDVQKCGTICHVEPAQTQHRNRTFSTSQLTSSAAIPGSPRSQVTGGANLSTR